MKTSLLKFAIVFIASILAFLGFRSLADYRLSYHEERENHVQVLLKNARDQLNRSHPLRALLFLEEISPELSSFPQYRKQWYNLALSSAVDLKDQLLLKILYEESPETFLENEKASLMIASVWLLDGQADLIESLSTYWNKEKSPYKEEWILLLADANAILKNREKALTLLQPKLSKNDNELNRLLRLSLMHLHEHPKVSWDFMKEAASLKSQDIDLDYYRAKLLLGSGYSDLANQILKRMTQSTKDPFFLSELIFLFLQQNQHDAAYTLAEKELARAPTPSMIQQGIFIHKIYRPIDYEWGHLSLNEHPETPFIRYLLAIPEDQLWDESLLYSQKAAAAKFGIEDIELQWLATLQALKMGDDIKALKLMKQFPDMQQIAPYLYIALQQAILAKNPYLPDHPVSEIPPPNKQRSRLKDLVENSSAPEVRKLLTHPEAYPLLLLAAGWNEAFLKMNPGQLKHEWPSWATYQATHALKKNRGIEAAMAFAKDLPQTPKLKLLLGQLYLEAKDAQTAYLFFEPFLKTSPKAAENWSAHLLQVNDFVQAKTVILDNAAYRDSLQGQERLAFIEYKLGNLEAADQLYRKLINSSSQAKSYWAAKAFQTKNYALSKKLLTLLTQEFPQDEFLKKQLVEVSALIHESP